MVVGWGKGQGSWRLRDLAWAYKHEVDLLQRQEITTANIYVARRDELLTPEL